MSVDVLFLGTGDAFGCGGRLQASTLVTCTDTSVLVDCGPATLPALRGHGIDPESIDTILLTHLHGDHFGGLPFFLMEAHYASRRTRPLTIVGPDAVESRVADAQEAFFAGNGRLPTRFPLTWMEWVENKAVTLTGLTVTPLAVAHAAEQPCFGLRLDCGGRVLAFSGDTEWTENLVPLAHEADLFVCECYGFKGAPPKHLSYAVLTSQRSRLTCRALYLTHLGEEMVRLAPTLDIPSAHDGLRISV